MRSRFLDYGARSVLSSSAQREKDAASKKTTNVLDSLADVQVPHSWFTSFYYTCVSCSILWLVDYTLGSPVASHLIYPSISTSRPSMSFPQVLLTWLAISTQGSRRLYESYAFARPSQSTMWVAHWALGIYFYSALSMAVWVEGVPALRKHTFNLADLSISAPSLRTLFSLCLFAMASGIQHDCHAYLASLKPKDPVVKSEYKLPAHPAFNLTVTPHYAAECMIYVAFSLLAAPEGCWANWTMVAALFFVAGNLGVTAHGTHKWYARRYGRKAVGGRWRMVPFVY